MRINNLLKNVLLVTILFVTTLISAKNLKFKDLPSKDIAPNGWAKEFLHRQITGLTGHPEEMGYPYNVKMWLEPLNYHDRQCSGGQDWWPYEQTAYYLDGALRCSYYTNNKSIYNRVRENINYIITNLNKDGRPYAPNVEDDKWPIDVLFRCLFEEYKNTGNKDILSAMEKYYKVTINNGDSFGGRDLLNVEILCDIYEVTGDKWFLDNAVKLYEDQAEETNGKSSTMYNGMINKVSPAGHAVTYHEFLKLPAVLYYYTGDKKYKKAIYSAYEMLEKNDMLADGLSSGVEHIMGNSEAMAHEFCNAIDFNWTSGWALRATGDGYFGDKMEKDLYNAGFSSILSDFKAHQYYSAPNMPFSTDMSSNYNDDLSWGLWGKDRFCYRPGHDTECCSGNMHRLFTTYLNRACLTAKNSVKVILYLPLSFNVPNGNDEILFTEKTNYPFDFSSKFIFDKDTHKSIDFQLRIPAWANSFTLTFNGKDIKAKQNDLHFTSIKKRFKKGDIVEIKFETEPRLVKSAHGGAINYGPLVFSNPLQARTRITTSDSGDKCSKAFPAYQLFPLKDKDWGYALSSKLTAKDIEVVKTGNKNYPWDYKKSPLIIRVKAKKLTNWQPKDFIYVSEFPKELKFSGEEDTLEMYPLGGTLLRITDFPLY